MVTPGNSVTSECLHREEAEVAPMAKVRRSRSAFVPFSPHLPRALVGAQTEKRRVPQPTLRCPLHEPYLRNQLRPHPLHLPHLVGRHAPAPAGRLRVGRSTKGQSWTWCGFSVFITSRRRCGTKPALTLPANRSPVSS